jgi:hypothetical protein
MMVAKPASPSELMTVKVCKKCGVSKPLSNFYRLAISPDGHERVCIDCRNDRESVITTSSKTKLPKITATVKKGGTIKIRCPKCSTKITPDIHIPSYPTGIYQCECSRCAVSMLVEVAWSSMPRDEKNGIFWVQWLWAVFRWSSQSRWTHPGGMLNSHSRDDGVHDRRWSGLCAM